LVHNSSYHKIDDTVLLKQELGGNSSPVDIELSIRDAMRIRKIVEDNLWGFVNNKNLFQSIKNSEVKELPKKIVISERPTNIKKTLKGSLHFEPIQLKLLNDTPTHNLLPILSLSIE
jgi:hypothetical protein